MIMQITMIGIGKREKVKLHPAARVWDRDSIIIVALVCIVACIVFKFIGVALSLCLVWFINTANRRTAEEFTELLNELEREQERNK